MEVKIELDEGNLVFEKEANGVIRVKMTDTYFVCESWLNKDELLSFIDSLKILCKNS